MFCRTFLSLASLLGFSPIQRILRTLPEWPARLPDASDHGEYRGYWIEWTGWKFSVSNSVVAGQWLALPMRDGKPSRDYECQSPYLFSSVPGSCGWYSPGTTFDLTPRPHQETPNNLREFHTDSKLRERMREQGLADLLKMIDDLHAGRDIPDTDRCVFWRKGMKIER